MKGYKYQYLYHLYIHNSLYLIEFNPDKQFNAPYAAREWSIQVFSSAHRNSNSIDQFSNSINEEMTNSVYANMAHHSALTMKMIETVDLKNNQYQQQLTLKREYSAPKAGKLLSCTVEGCEYKTPSKYSLDSHMFSHSGEKPYKCEIIGCCYSTVRKHDLTSHMSLRHHENSTSTPVMQQQAHYACNFPNCLYTATREGDLIIHKRGHTGEKPYKCTIDGCTYSAVRLCDLRNHHRSWHSDQYSAPKERTKIHKCSYDECSYSTPSKRELKNHLGDHIGKQTYGCPMDGCLFRTARRDTLPEHLRRKHIVAPITPNEGRYLCPMDGCGYEYSDVDEYKTHFMSHLPPLYHCQKKDCDFACHKMKSLEIHSLMHSGETIFKCEYPKCTYVSRNEHQFKIHLFKHEFDKSSHDFTGGAMCNPQIFKCQQDGCQYTTPRRDHYVRHFYTHNTQRVKPFQCFYSTCNFSTDNKYYIKKHIENHAPTQSQCNFISCGYIASSYYDDRMHSISHQHQSPYKCPFIGCDSSFPTHDNLCDHVNNEHPPSDVVTQLKKKNTRNIKEYVCPLQECPYVTRIDQEFREHLLIHRSMPPMYPCPYPSCRDLLSYYAIGSHLKNHPDGSVLSCIMFGCEYKTTTLTDLLKHIDGHSNCVEFGCFLSSCNQICKNREELIRHLEEHIEDTETSCPTNCGFQTAIKSLMSFHLYAHKFGYPFNRLYPCPFLACLFSSATYSALKSHTMTHTNERPYNCKFCNYSARKSSHLKNHLDSKHSANRDREMINLKPKESVI